MSENRRKEFLVEISRAIRRLDKICLKYELSSPELGCFPCPLNMVDKEPVICLIREMKELYEMNICGLKVKSHKEGIERKRKEVS